MDMKQISLPEVYTDSADFRFFRTWIISALEKIQYDTEHLYDLYDPLRCKRELLWMLADTIGFKYDDRLPAAFNRLVLVYFMDMIRRRGSIDGVMLSAQTNLDQFVILDKAEADSNGAGESIYYDRLDDTSIPVNAVSVIPHTAAGYIDVVYFSSRLPKDACIEYTRPLGLFCFQYAGVKFDARTKISIDPRLANIGDVYANPDITQIDRYSRNDYARLQKASINGVDESDTRKAAWDRNSDYEDNTYGDGTYGSGTNPNIDPGYRALRSLQLSNNDEIIKALLPPLWSLGYGPQTLDTVFPDDYYLEPLADNAWNLRYDKQLDEDNTPMADGEYYTSNVDDERSTSILDFKPMINPIMSTIGDAISLSLLNDDYYGIESYDDTDASDYIYRITDNKVYLIYYIGTSQRPRVPATIEGCPVVGMESTCFNYKVLKYASLPDTMEEIL